jgi:hypothetical protein
MALLGPGGGRLLRPTRALEQKGAALGDAVSFTLGRGRRFSSRLMSLSPQW